MGCSPWGLEESHATLSDFPFTFHFHALEKEMARDVVQSPRLEDPLEEGMATHSSIFAWKTLWTEEPGRLQTMGLPRVRHD